MSIDNPRNINWAMWLNKLIFCYGCGRFGMPIHNKLPKGWKLLYQPHSEGRPGLHVCSQDCGGKVQDAMKKGPIVEPLEMRTPPMPHELQKQVIEVVKEVEEEGRAEHQGDILKRIQDYVDWSLIAAVESHNGKLSREEAISVVNNAIVDSYFDVGFTVTAKIDFDDNGFPVADIRIMDKPNLNALRSFIPSYIPIQPYVPIQNNVPGQVSSPEMPITLMPCLQEKEEKVEMVCLKQRENALEGVVVDFEISKVKKKGGEGGKI